MKKLLLAFAAIAAVLGVKADEHWYFIGSSTKNNNVFTTAATTCWTNSAGGKPSGQLGTTDICHIQDGKTWRFGGATIPINELHLGATDGSTGGTLYSDDGGKINVPVFYWHNGTWTGKYASRQLGLLSGEAYLDCANKTHTLQNTASSKCFLRLDSNLHCDEQDLVLTISGSGSSHGISLCGDNADYQGSISLTTGSGITFLPGHANALGDPDVARADALKINGASAVMAVMPNVSLNSARGIAINKSGFTLFAGNVSLPAAKAGNTTTFDCSNYELQMPISGSYGFTKTGTGTVTYSGEYTATGAIVVKGGKFVIAADATFPAGQAITVTNATLEVHQSLSNFTITEQAGSTVVRIVDPIVVPFDPETHTVTTVTRRRLTVEPGTKQPISLSAAYPVPCHEAYELEVLRIASGSPDLTDDDFEDGTAKSFGLPRTTLTVTKDGEGVQHVVISVRPVVKSLGQITSINADAAKWSDTLAPHPGADYLCAHEVFNAMNAVFSGDSLTIANVELEFRSSSQKFETESGEPVIICPGARTTQSYNGRDFDVSGSIFLSGDYGAASYFDFNLIYGKTAGKQGTLCLSADLSGAGTLQVRGVANGTSWNGIYGNNTNYFGKIVMTGNGTTAEFKGTQVRVEKPESFGGLLDEFHSDAITIKDYAMVKAIADVALTNDMNRGFYISNDGGFNCDAGKTFKTTWPIKLNGTLYKHGTGTLILGGAMSHDTGSTGNFVVRGGAIGILSDAAAEGLTVKATNDFAIVVSSESTAVNGFTGFNLTPPPGSETLPKVTVKVDAEKLVAGNVNKLPICTVANDSGITVDTFVVERVPHYLCSLVAEPVDATTTRYSLKCSKPGLIIVVE